MAPGLRILGLVIVTEVLTNTLCLLVRITWHELLLLVRFQNAPERLSDIATMNEFGACKP